MPDAARAAFAAYGAVLPVPAGSPAESTGATVLDATSVKAGRQQGRAEVQAELDQVREQLAAVAGAHRRVRAVLRLCEGRRGDELLLVAAVATAAEAGTTAVDGLPMTLTWNRSARVPDAHDAHKQVVIECTSAYGGRADLVVEGDDRMALASLVDSEIIRDINAPCPHEAGCGSDDAHLDSAGVFGWFRVDVGGLDGGPRWYCSPGCVNAAMQRAGDDLALADEAARYPEAVVGSYPQAPADTAEDLDARYGPGASDEYAAQVAEATEAGFEDERGDDGDGAL